MFNDTILLDSSLYLIRQRFATTGKSGILLDLTHHLSQLTQGGNGKQVRRNQEPEQRSIIRRTERRDNQSDRFDRTTPSIIQQCIALAVGSTGKLVRSQAIFPLLRHEGIVNRMHSLFPISRESGCISRLLPEVISQTDRIAKRVDLPFTLVQLLLHLGMVALPFTTRSTFIEGIGIGIDVDAPGLSMNHTQQHVLHPCIIIGKLYIREYLSRRVAQPHGMNITCDDKGIWFTIPFLMLTGGIQRIGETVFEHPSQFWVLQLSLGFPDSLFDSLRGELPFIRSRTLAHIIRQCLSR